MAAYAGTVTVLWSVSLGNKVITLTSVAVTNYNQTGIPLIGRHAGMDVIEWLGLNVVGPLTDSQSPLAITYDSVNKVCHLYRGPDLEVDDNINLHSSIGDLILLVVGK